MESFADQHGQDLELIRSLNSLSLGDSEDPPSGDEEVQIFRQYVDSLERQLLDILRQKENDMTMCKASAECTFAKNNAGRILVALFDHANGAKVDGLKVWWETGNIQTRNGPAHWRVDPRTLRDKRGFNFLHAAVNRNLAKESSKIALVELLVDTMGFDVNATDFVGRTSLHLAALNGYEDLVQCLLSKGANPIIKDKAGMTALSIVQQVSGIPEGIVKALLAAEREFRRDASLSPPNASQADVLASVYFLKRLKKYFSIHYKSTIEREVANLFKKIQTLSDGSQISLDTITRELSLDRNVETIFTYHAFTSPGFINAFKIEGSRFSIYSSVDEALHPPATWINFIQRVLHKCSIAHTDFSSIDNERQVWYYAALYYVQAEEIPRRLDVQKGSTEAHFSTKENISVDLSNNILIQGQIYCIVAQTSELIILDRPFEGPTARECKAYNVNSSLHPPYISVLKLEERTPGNKFDKMSAEDEMTQDYQRIAPDESFEIAMKIGPVIKRSEAVELVKEWKATCKDAFLKHECISGHPMCSSSCPQKAGKYLCRYSMEKVGNDLAQKYFGRTTYSKALAPRATIQRLQNNFSMSKNGTGFLPISILGGM
ncbi:hypothetical protein Ae201684P_009749 [Aphanomyces euteiches]|nr:hypothetical protein Ae201684P_009749 [Aphanomyces euteiches]